MAKECPSCGNIVDDGQLFCPMCGTKIHVIKSTNQKENKFLKDEIAKAETYATVVLYTKSKIVFKEVNTAEINFLNIIEKFPSEPEAYIAYVNFITQYIDRIVNPHKGDECIFFNDLKGLIEKCKSFLDKALRYANEDIDGNLLQEISKLQNRLDTFKLDDSVQRKSEKNKKSNKILIGVIIVCIVIFIISQLFK